MQKHQCSVNGELVHKKVMDFMESLASDEDMTIADIVAVQYEFNGIMDEFLKQEGITVNDIQRQF